jgi:hypothetical protein
MQRFLSYTFPAAGVTVNATEVAQSQALTAAGSLTLNGSLVNTTTGVMSFASHGYSRNISLYSASNFSGVAFTIVGVQNGVPVSEVIAAGPNNTTVYSVQIYDTVASITSNGGVAAPAVINAGVGGLGFFPLIGINLWPEVVNYTLTLASLTTAGDPEAALWGSLGNIANNGSTYLQTVTAALAFTVPVINIEEMGANTPPLIYTNSGKPTYGFLLVEIGNDNTEAAKALQMNFIQT